MLYQDGEAVHLDRNEILEACGIESQWAWQSEHFEFGEEAPAAHVAVPTAGGLGESEDEDMEDLGAGKRRRID